MVTNKNTAKYLIYKYNVRGVAMCYACIRNSRFGRGTEEDSHEALRYLLSALRQEEIKVHCHSELCMYISIHCAFCVINNS